MSSCLIKQSDLTDQITDLNSLFYLWAFKTLTLYIQLQMYLINLKFGSLKSTLWNVIVCGCLLALFPEWKCEYQHPKSPITWKPKYPNLILVTGTTSLLPFLCCGHLAPISYFEISVEHCREITYPKAGDGELVHVSHRVWKLSHSGIAIDVRLTSTHDCSFRRYLTITAVVTAHQRCLRAPHVSIRTCTVIQLTPTTRHTLPMTSFNWTSHCTRTLPGLASQTPVLSPNMVKRGSLWVTYGWEAGGSRTWNAVVSL